VPFQLCGNTLGNALSTTPQSRNWREDWQKDYGKKVKTKSMIAQSMETVFLVDAGRKSGKL
jgi:hypothetical protein